MRRKRAHQSVYWIKAWRGDNPRCRRHENGTDNRKIPCLCPSHHSTALASDWSERYLHRPLPPEMTKLGTQMLFLVLAVFFTWNNLYLFRAAVNEWKPFGADGESSDSFLGVIRHVGPALICADKGHSRACSEAKTEQPSLTFCEIWELEIRTATTQGKYRAAEITQTYRQRLKEISDQLDQYLIQILQL